MAVTSMIGARIQRREDPKLITGHGHFIDDVNLVNMAHMSVVRSPYAHARITSIDTSAAKAAKGVVAVLTAADFKPVILGPLPVTNSFVADKKQVPEQFPIADGRGRVRRRARRRRDRRGSVPRGRRRASRRRCTTSPCRR